MKNKGFTLTELLAVIAIIAILSIAAISGYSTMTRNGKEKTLKTKVDAIENAAYKFAKENNIDRKTTISVNKLVVMGYLQADDTSDEGLSMYLNPVTGDNMICNTIDLTITNNDVIVKYNTTKKNCSLANEEEDAAKIKVTGYCTNVLTLTGDTFAWTKCETVYIRTNPNGLDVNKIESITFDYDGNSIVKKTGDIASSNSTDTNRYKNVVAVKGVKDQVVTTDVGITYTMKDGKVYFRHVIVRIDLQIPTLTYVLKNNTKIGAGGVQERSFEVYVDDANGAGSEGFYISTGEEVGSARYVTTDYKKTVSTALGRWYLIPKDKVGNVGKPIGLTVENVPGNLSCIMSLFKNDKRTEVARSNNWYNYDIAVREHSEAYSNGVSYGILKATPITNRSQLPNYANENEVINHFFNPTQTAEMEITKFYGGLWNVQHKGVTVCTRDVGIDKTRPTISLSPDHHDTHEQFHNVVITITDPGTVVSGFYKSGRDEMRSGSPKYELKYAWVKNGTSASSVPSEKWKTVYPTKVEPSNLINTNTTNKLTYSILNERVDYAGTKMTGSYRLIVLSDTLQDLAGNYNIGTTSGIYKMDNTPPKCETDGGNKNWVNYYLTLTGTCTDHEGTTDQSECVSDISKLYNYEINSDHETPGTIYDHAGNSTLCDDDQQTHIDLTDPTCSVGLSGTAGSNSWYKANNVNVSLTKDDKGGSGLDVHGLTNSNSEDYNSSTSNTQGSTNGTTWYGWVKDVAGNKGSCNSGSFKVDTTIPSCTYSENSSWTKSNVTVSWGCSDTYSGCSTAAGSKSFTGNNSATKTHSISYSISDKAGNTKDCSKTLNVYHDEKDPSCSISHDGSKATWTCSDGHSGINGDTSGTVNLSGSKQKVSKTCTDSVGNTKSCSKTYHYSASSACGKGSPCHKSDPDTCHTCELSKPGCNAKGGTFTFDNPKSGSTAGCCDYPCTKDCEHTCYPTCWHE